MPAYDEMELAFFMLKFQVINLVYILVPRTEENIFKTKFKFLSPIRTINKSSLVKKLINNQAL